MNRAIGTPCTIVAGGCPQIQRRAPQNSRAASSALARDDVVTTVERAARPDRPAAARTITVILGVAVETVHPQQRAHAFRQPRAVRLRSHRGGARIQPEIRRARAPDARCSSHCMNHCFAPGRRCSAPKTTRVGAGILDAAERVVDRGDRVGEVRQDRHQEHRHPETRLSRRPYGLESCRRGRCARLDEC